MSDEVYSDSLVVPSIPHVLGLVSPLPFLVACTYCIEPVVSSYYHFPFCLDPYLCTT
jgi:hypothetical protein